MARDITAIGTLRTLTVRRAGAITGSEDQFSLPPRNESRATDWYTFTLAFVATSLTIRSTPRPQSHDMEGWLFNGTITPSSAISALGSHIEYDADSGTNLNFQISRTNLAAGDYTIAVQRFTVHNAAYGLEVVAVVPGAPTPPSAPAAPSVIPSVGAASTAVLVSWVAPDDGGMAITGYDIRYREGSTGSFTPWPFSGTGTLTLITGLKSGAGYQVQVKAKNRIGNSRWGLSGEAVTEGPAAVVTLEIDWGNDGTFSHASADVTSDLVRYSLRTTRGRTLQSRRKSVAGRLEAKLWNIEAKYDPINSSSPVFEKGIAGLRVRAKLAGVVIWAGRIDSHRYRNRPVPQLDIIALGVLSTLRQPVSVAEQSQKTVGAVAKIVGVAAGIETTHLDGDKTLNRWPGVANQDALGALHDLEEYERGFLKERADGELELEPGDARLTGDSAVSALTLTDQIRAATDVPILKGSALDWGFRQIANVVNVSVTPLAPSANVITLWSSSAIRINAGVALDFRIGYPADRGSPTSHIGVESWIDPVAGTDYTAQTGLSVRGVADGNLYVVTFRNTNQPGQRPGSGTHIVVGPFTLRGTPLVAGSTSYIQTKDSASITAFGEREYARPSPLFTDIGIAQEYADGIVNHRKEPHGWLVARWPAKADVVKASSLDLSRRITVERLGETVDYYIEAVSLSLPGFLRMSYLLSPVPGVTTPSAPRVTVSAVPGKTTQVAVSWSEPFDGGSLITDYAVRYKRSTDSTWTAWPHTGTGLTATITGLLGGVSYSVQVQATNAQGTSSWSTSAMGSTATVVPLAPSAPTVTGGKKQLSVSWVAPYDGESPITGYAVQYKLSTASIWIAWPHTGTGRTATITGLTDSTAYEVQVLATNSVGSSPWSNSASASTLVGKLLIADNTGNGLWEIDPDGADSEGTRLRQLPAALTTPFGMTVLAGRLLIADWSYDQIVEIDPDGADTEGTLLRDLPAALTNPNAMTVLAGRLLIADGTGVGSELWEIDPDGADTEGTLLRDLPAALTNPAGMTVLAGRLLIADGKNDELWEIDPDGADTEGTLLRDLPAGLVRATAMTVSAGRLLIADTGILGGTDDGLWEIDPDGADTEGTLLRDLPAALTAPTGMAVF